MNHSDIGNKETESCQLETLKSVNSETGNDFETHVNKNNLLPQSVDQRNKLQTTRNSADELELILAELSFGKPEQNLSEHEVDDKMDQDKMIHSEDIPMRSTITPIAVENEKDSKERIVNENTRLTLWHTPDPSPVIDEIRMECPDASRALPQIKAQMMEHTMIHSDDIPMRSTITPIAVENEKDSKDNIVNENKRVTLWHTTDPSPVIYEIRMECHDASRALPQIKAQMIEETVISKKELTLDYADVPSKVTEKQPRLNFRPPNFGTVFFQNRTSTNINLAKFAELQEETNLADVYHLLTEIWLIPDPIFLISIIGGTRDKQLDDKLVESVKSGFDKVLDTLAAWVTTDGGKRGILKEIIEDITEMDENTVIGIRSWNNVKNRKSLEERIDMDKNEYFYKSSNFNKDESKEFLDSNHSHFLLIDYNFDKVTESLSSIFRSNLENYIIETENGPSAVIVLIDGGADELHYLCRALKRTTKMPVVVVKGTGGIADVICYALENLNEDLKNLNENIFKEDLWLFACKTFKEVHNEEKSTICKQIVSCLKMNTDLFSIFDVEENDISRGFDDVLLRSLIQKNNKTTYEKLQQCIFWNRVDIMKDIDISNLNEDDLDNAVIMAVALNQVEIVEDLLNIGDFDETVFDETCLAFLYGFQARNESSILKYSNKQLEFLSEIKLKELNGEDSSTNQKKIYQFLCHFKKYDDDIFVSYNDILPLFAKFSQVFHTNTCMKDHFAQFEWRNNKTADHSKIWGDRNENKGSTNIYQILLVWAVINNMHKMALLFWKICDNRLPCAIIAAELSKAIGNEAKKLRLNIGYSNQYFENAEKWKHIALKVIDELYFVGLFETKQILTKPFCNCLDKQINSIQKQSSLELAYISNFQELIAHNAVQQILSDMWTNRFHLPRYSILKVFFTVLFPPLVVFTHGKKKKKYSVRHNNNKKKNKHEVVQQAAKQRERKISDGSSSDSNQDEELLTDKRGKIEVERKSPLKQLKSKMILYVNTPLVKFYSNTVTFLVFLSILTNECINKRKEAFITRWEYVLLIFVISYTTEEFHQIFIMYRRSYQKKVYKSIKLHFQSFWNKMDAVAIVLFYIGLGLRIHKETNEYGILIYGIDAWFWILRILHTFYADPILGPYVIVIGRMFNDIFQFVTILLVFVVAYGVTSTTIIRPKETSYLWLRDVFFQPYFNIYGELFIEAEKEPGKTRFGGDDVNKYSEPIALIFLGLYLLIANVLLLNLLIAIFGNTFSEVQQKSDRIWKYNRYAFIYGYKHTPWLLQPFTCIGHLYNIIKWLCQTSCQKTKETRNKVKENQTKVSYVEVLQFRKLQTRIVTRVLHDISANEENQSGGVCS